MKAGSYHLPPLELNMITASAIRASLRPGRPSLSPSFVKLRIKRFALITSIAVLSFAGFGMPRAAIASTAYGTLNNFDCVNDTGVEAHGFDIELDDVRSKDITYTYDWNHYGVPKITEDLTDPLHPKVLVRYVSAKNLDGTWAAYTAIPSGPISPTQGHQFTDPSVNFGGEHFGVGFYGVPTAVRYFWLVDNGGTLIHGAPVYVSTPTFTYNAPVGGAPANVVAVVIPPPPPAPPVYQFGEASWVKAIKTTTHNAGKIHLNDLVGDDPGKPQPWANGEPDEVETEWRILQTEFAAGNGGKNGELAGAEEDLPGGDEVVTRRYEFYKYVGPIDAETGEAMGDEVGPDGIHGKGTVTYADHFDPNTGEWVTVTVDLSTVVVVGDFFGAQMAGFDVAPVLGLIDNVQSADANVAYPERTVVIGGGSPFVALVTSGVLPIGMNLDSVTGVLSGTPTTAGIYTFTVDASDLGGAYVTKTYNLTVVGEIGPALFTISAIASPVAGGSATGGGTYGLGDPVSLLAIPNAGYYFVDWTEGGAHFAYTPGYNFNAASNRSLVANFVMDTTAPVSEAGVTGPLGGGGWYLGAAQVTLSANDDLSGVNNTFYKIDGGATNTYAGPFNVSGNGQHNVSFWSEDVAGNPEVPQTQAVGIDALAPTLTTTANPNRIWPTNSKMVTVTISGTVTDALSGPNTATGTYSTLDSYGFVEPSGTFAIAPNGTYSFTIQVEAMRNKKDTLGRTYTVTLHASDVAGNEASKSVDILIPFRKNG